VPGPRHALDATISYTHMIADAGMRPGVQILSSTTRPSTHEEARDFDLEDGALVRCLERLRTADGRAVIYSLDVLPETVLAGVSEKALTRSLYDVLERIGHRVVSANAVLLPVVADGTLAQLLGVDVGSPLQQISEIDFTRKGHAVILSSEWHVPGVFELRVNRRP
jgi:GntR family transcriptional regulator